MCYPTSLASQDAQAKAGLGRSHQGCRRKGLCAMHMILHATGTYTVAQQSTMHHKLMWGAHWLYHPLREPWSLGVAANDPPVSNCRGGHWM